tara:strand:- start:104903 stop:105598 length:696 start_codon:yes stop_codon:yes gene_type:complete
MNKHGKSFGLYNRLKNDSGHNWTNYISHPFVEALGDGTLPIEAFRYYLKQDYLFLIDFSRAWGLAAFKSEKIDHIRAASKMLDTIINLEINLHINFCKDWDISLKDLEKVPKEPRSRAYIDHVFDCGLKGDILDLHVALAPCIVGYGEIGRNISQKKDYSDNNPFKSWVEMYSSDSYQETAKDEMETLDLLYSDLGSAVRYNKLSEIFNKSTKLEAAFWQMSFESCKLGKI